MKTTFLLAALVVATAVAWSPASAQTLQSSALAQVRSQRIFPTPLEWAGPQEPAAADSEAVLAAAESFQSGGAKAGLAALESFLTAHPRSPWAASLHV